MVGPIQRSDEFISRLLTANHPAKLAGDKREEPHCSSTLRTMLPSPLSIHERIHGDRLLVPEKQMGRIKNLTEKASNFYVCPQRQPVVSTVVRLVQVYLARPLCAALRNNAQHTILRGKEFRALHVNQSA